MQESIHKKHAELLALQNNAPEILNLKSSELIHTEQIEDSALHFVNIKPENETEKWFVAIGKKRITEYYASKEECEQQLHSWKFQIDLIAAVFELSLEAAKYEQ